MKNFLFAHRNDFRVGGAVSGAYTVRFSCLCSFSFLLRERWIRESTLRIVALPGRGMARPVVSTKTVGYPDRAKRVASVWCRCQRKSHLTPARITTDGFTGGSSLPFHQGVRSRGVRHRPLAVDAIQAEERQDLSSPLQVVGAHVGTPSVYGRQGSIPPAQR